MRWDSGRGWTRMKGIIWHSALLALKVCLTFTVNGNDIYIPIQWFKMVFIMTWTLPLHRERCSTTGITAGIIITFLVTVLVAFWLVNVPWKGFLGRKMSDLVYTLKILSSRLNNSITMVSGRDGSGGSYTEEWSHINRRSNDTQRSHSSSLSYVLSPYNAVMIHALGSAPGTKLKPITS